MRHQLLTEGAEVLSYEIREIVIKALKIKELGQDIFWENIGDPIQKNLKLPNWIKDIVVQLALEDSSYGYCASKGVLETRNFIASTTNAKGGVQITADDICFFNGLGDAIAKVYNHLSPSSRVILPSPVYSPHSTAESIHAHQPPITYKLDSENKWYPDLQDLYNKVKNNPHIVAILVVNPDNPTGMVYPLDTMKKIVEIAKEFNLFLISDEIYGGITYNGTTAISLAEVIGKVPGIAMKGISKVVPWPGSRCGWLEYYNRQADADFNRYCSVLDDAKMIEVCSTKLPQLSIPKILGDPRFMKYRQELNDRIGKRSQIIADILSPIPELTFNKTYGAFYNTIIFRKDTLSPNQTMKIENNDIRQLVESWTSKNISKDKRFAYYLLGAKGVCVVPISSFCSDLLGFRVTLLEGDDQLLKKTFTLIKEGIVEYLSS